MAGTLPFRRVAIIGTGLIGGSFALALRKHYPDVRVAGYERPEVLQRAMALGAVNEAAADLASAVRSADLVYLALPIVPTLEILPEIAKSAKAEALVTDACSTKAVICRTARENFRDGALFLGGHPMAGKEQSGIEHADDELFRGAPYALIGSEDSADARAKVFAELLAEIGAQPTWCDAETHDWAVGIVSHLPQLVSLALARVVQDETDETGLPLSLAGHGLQDMLRLAGSPYAVWRDILLTNTENVSRALDRLAQTIDYLRTRLATKELEQEFQAANEIYKLLQKPR
jgi:prephenate dehydrogenase